MSSLREEDASETRRNVGIRTLGDVVGEALEEELECESEGQVEQNAEKCENHPRASTVQQERT